MKILAIGDLHGKIPKNINKLVKKNKPDIILCTGDFGNSELIRKIWFKNLERNQKGLKSILRKKDLEKAFLIRSNSTINVLKYLSKIAPTYGVYGNIEPSDDHMGKYRKEFGIKIPFPRESIKKIPNTKIIDRKTIKIKNIKIGGIGFFVESSWLKLFRPEEYNERIENVKKKDIKIKKILKKFGKVDILLCHQPPYGILDKVSAKFAPKLWKNKHAGSKILLDYIKKQQPRYVFCGHIHEAKGFKKIGKTKGYNLGLRKYKIINV